MDEASAGEDIASRGGGVEGESRATWAARRVRDGVDPYVRVGCALLARSLASRHLGRRARLPIGNLRLFQTRRHRSFRRAGHRAEDARHPRALVGGARVGGRHGASTPNGDAGSASSSGAFGCDVRTEHGRRKRGARSSLQIGSTASAPSTAVDAAALRDALAVSPLACVNITATWCAPCVRFHPKFLNLSASFPDVAFVSVDIDTLDDDALDELAVETVPCFCS